MSATQDSLKEAAKRRPGRAFTDLYPWVCSIDVLSVAWAEVKGNRGKEGTDGQTIDDILASGEDLFVATLADDLRFNRYAASTLRRVWIPKNVKDLRPLGIPVLRDRVVQAAVTLIIEPIFEADFMGCSYGSRPGIGPHDAVRAIVRQLRGGFDRVVDADITKFFDTIPHPNLTQLVRRRVADPQVLDLIDGWLKAGILEGCTISMPQMGTPQGGVISPLLANVYLHELDKRIVPACGRRAHHIRYVDDFLILCRSADAERLLGLVRVEIARLGLSLNERKTGTPEVEDGFNFLGFTFKALAHKRGPRDVFFFPTRERVDREIVKLPRVLAMGRRKHGLVGDGLLRHLCQSVSGWANYVDVSSSLAARRRVARAAERVFLAYMRRHPALFPVPLNSQQVRAEIEVASLLRKAQKV